MIVRYLFELAALIGRKPTALPDTNANGGQSTWL
jgi:hypothetical protein